MVYDETDFCGYWIRFRECDNVSSRVVASSRMIFAFSRILNSIISWPLVLCLTAWVLLFFKHAVDLEVGHQAWYFGFYLNSTLNFLPLKFRRRFILLEIYRRCIFHPVCGRLSNFFLPHRASCSADDVPRILPLEFSDFSSYLRLLCTMCLIPKASKLFLPINNSEWNFKRECLNIIITDWVPCNGYWSWCLPEA